MTVERLVTPKRFWSNLVRLLGIPLLIYLLFKLDPSQIYSILIEANIWKVVLALFLTLLLIAIKTFRWQVVLNAQGVYYGFVPAYLAYFASMFVGFLTPGRIGEFSKAIYVVRELKISSGRAFSGVLADRLFDLSIVVIISVIALAKLFINLSGWIALFFIALLSIPAILLLNDSIYARVQKFGSGIGGFVGDLFANHGWLDDIRQGFLALSWKSLVAALFLTVAAYALYFLQCQILACSLGLRLSYFQIAYVISLAGLITLMPISIAGLGTREAVVVYYLGGVGIQSDKALSFSLLVFFVFYISTSLVGALAWLIKPLPLDQLKDEESMQTKLYSDLDL